MNVGDTVRIIQDEYPELVGLIGVIEEVSDDGTAGWVVLHAGTGVWCAHWQLEKID